MRGPEDKTEAVAYGRAMTSKRYAVFGAGRVGRAMAAYLGHLGHEAVLVTRSETENAPEKCREQVAWADVVAAAIPDGRIAEWAEKWRGDLAGKPAIHFSGALSVGGMFSYHPLFSFPRAGLSPAIMRGIVFARQEGAPSFAEIVPGAPNHEFVVADADRAYYHALAVLSGNFAAFLWNETASGLAGRLKIAPETVLSGYFFSIVERFRESPYDSLTGPVTRHDAATVEANLDALAADPKLAGLYRAFLRAAWPNFEPSEG